jgi:hypothetical protein
MSSRQEIVAQTIDDALAKVFPVVLLKIISDYTVSSNGLRIESWPVSRGVKVVCLEDKLYTNASGFSVISYNQLKDKQFDWLSSKRPMVAPPAWFWTNFDDDNAVISTEDGKELWYLTRGDEGAIFCRLIIDAFGLVTSQPKSDIVLDTGYCMSWAVVEPQKHVWLICPHDEPVKIKIINFEGKPVLDRIPPGIRYYGPISFDGNKCVWIVDKNLNVIRYNVCTFLPAKSDEGISNILKSLAKEYGYIKSSQNVEIKLVGNEMWIFLTGIVCVICIFDTDGNLLSTKHRVSCSYQPGKPFVVQNEVFFFSSSPTQRMLTRIY